MDDLSVSQTDLDRKTGIQAKKISDYLNERLNFSEHKRAQIAAAIGRSYLSMLTLGKDLYSNIESYFESGLIELNKNLDFHLKTKKIDSETKRYLDKSLDDLLYNDFKPTLEQYENIASKFKLPLEGLLYLGKKACSRSDTRLKHVDPVQSQMTLSPTPLDPAIEILHEILQETGEELTPEKAIRVAKALKQILKHENTPENVADITREHQNKVSEFQDQEEGYMANCNLISIEKEDPDLFYELTSLIRGKAKSIARKKKNRAHKKAAGDGI